MNVQLRRVTLTRRDGKVSTLEHVFIRGSKIRFFILPDILASAPMFKRVEGLKDGRPVEARGLGRGRGIGGAARGAATAGKLSEAVFALPCAMLVCVVSDFFCVCEIYSCAWAPCRKGNGSSGRTVRFVTSWTLQFGNRGGEGGVCTYQHGTFFGKVIRI